MVHLPLGVRSLQRKLSIGSRALRLYWAPPRYFSAVEELAAAERGPLETQRWADYFACSPNTPNVGGSNMVLHDVARSAGVNLDLSLIGCDDWALYEDWDLAMQLGTAGLRPLGIAGDLRIPYGPRRARIAEHLSQVPGSSAHDCAGGAAGNIQAGGHVQRRRALLTRHSILLSSNVCARGYLRQAWGLYLSTVGGRFTYS